MVVEAVLRLDYYADRPLGVVLSYAGSSVESFADSAGCPAYSTSRAGRMAFGGVCHVILLTIDCEIKILHGI